MTSTANETVQDLFDSLDELERVLAPLLATRLTYTLSKLDVMEKAKMQATLAYVTQDLIFMYLKTKGIDPVGHHVMAQMTEIAKYFTKIKEVEDPEKRRLAVDKDAARRFIDAALRGAMPVSGNVINSDTSPAQTIGNEMQAHTKMTAKQIERRRLGEEDDSSEEDEEITIVTEPTTRDVPQPSELDGSVSDGAKKRRHAMDPFAGYDSNYKASQLSGISIEPNSKKRKQKSSN